MGYDRRCIDIGTIYAASHQFIDLASCYHTRYAVSGSQMGYLDVNFVLVLSSCIAGSPFSQNSMSNKL